VQTDYVFWVFVIVVGILISYFGRNGSWRLILRIHLAGAASFLLGLTFGLASDFSSTRLLDLLLFDKKLAPWAGNVEYRLIAVGYALVLGGLVLLLRRLLGSRRVSSNSSFEKDA
jgi:hypothetical protein